MKKPLALILFGTFAMAACSPSGSTQCSGDEARELIDGLFKEELEYAVQNQLDKQKELGSYDATELETAVRKLGVNLDDVRTSQDDPNSKRSSCRATIKIDIPNAVERKANETRAMAEIDDVRELANTYKMKRKGGVFAADFEYFIQPTDDGSKLLAEMDDDSAAISFMSEVLASYLLSDEIREEKIEQDQAAAAEKAVELAAERKEREEERAEQARIAEIDDAFNQEGVAALAAAKVERKLASERIGAVWLAMPQTAKDELEDLHSAWVKQMKARCAVRTAGTDKRASMREARELTCQTGEVRKCATTLEANLRRTSRFQYCSYRN